jgi:hypothetical protein
LPKALPHSIKVISESHYILYDNAQKIKIKFFTISRELIQEDNIFGGFIENEDASIKFIADTIEVVKIHNEYYLDAVYYGYELHLKLPDITDSYYLESFYLKLNIQDKVYSFFAGSLYVEYPVDNENFIEWYGLEGIKDDGPQLFQILVDLKYLDVIDDIQIGPNMVDFFIGVNNLVIQVEPNPYVFSSTFVRINTHLGVTYLPNFTYFMNYELLNSGLYVTYRI